MCCDGFGIAVRDEHIDVLKEELATLWWAIRTLDLGECQCGKPAVDAVEHYDKKSLVCPMCLQQWNEAMMPHRDEYIKTLDTVKYREAWDTLYDMFFGKAN